MAMMAPPFPSPLPLDGTGTPHNCHAPPKRPPHTSECALTMSKALCGISIWHSVQSLLHWQGSCHYPLYKYQMAAQQQQRQRQCRALCYPLLVERTASLMHLGSSLWMFRRGVLRRRGHAVRSCQHMLRLQRALIVRLVLRVNWWRVLEGVEVSSIARDDSEWLM